MNRLMRGAAATCMVAMMTLIGNSAAQNATALTDERSKLSYAIGLDVANGFQEVAEFVDVGALQKAVQNTFDGGQPLITQEEAQGADAALRATLAARSGQPTGLPPGVQPPAPDKTKVGLLLGSFAVGPGLVPLKEDIDLSILFQAVRTRFGNGTSLLSEEEARSVLSAYASRKQAEMAERQRVEGAKQIALGQEFLEKNKSVKGVITTPSGLQYQVLRAGSGERPVAASTVRVNYEGRLLDGKVFDSSYERGQPAEFPLGGVIAGWTEGIPLMNVGAKYRFWIPSELAYGERGAGNDIPANATLTFDVELLGVLQ